MQRQDPGLTRFARDMRKDPTRAEALLWWTLRGKSLGVKFRRQQPIGPFIADFACYSHKLIVEIDGLTHDGREKYDEERDEWFRRRGWRVFRTTDDEVWENLDGVVAGILVALRKAADRSAGDYYPLPGEAFGPPTLPKGG